MQFAKVHRRRLLLATTLAIVAAGLGYTLTSRRATVQPEIARPTSDAQSRRAAGHFWVDAPFVADTALAVHGGPSTAVEVRQVSLTVVSDTVWIAFAILCRGEVDPRRRIRLTVGGEAPNSQIVFARATEFADNRVPAPVSFITYAGTRDEVNTESVKISAEELSRVARLHLYFDEL